MSLKSLKLPTSILKSRQPASECPSDKVKVLGWISQHLAILCLLGFSCNCPNSGFICLFAVYSAFSFFFFFPLPLFRMPPFHELRRPSSTPTGIRHSAEARMTHVILFVLLSWPPHHSEDQGDKTPQKESGWKNVKPSTKLVLLSSKSRTLRPK